MREARTATLGKRAVLIFVPFCISEWSEQWPLTLAHCSSRLSVTQPQSGTECVDTVLVVTRGNDKTEENDTLVETQSGKIKMRKRWRQGPSCLLGIEMGNNWMGCERHPDTEKRRIPVKFTSLRAQPRSGDRFQTCSAPLLHLPVLSSHQSPSD